MTSSVIVKTEFSIPFRTGALRGDCFTHEDTAPPLLPLLLLHGGGKLTSRVPYDPLRQTLLQRSLPSFSFDFFGHGQTGGNLLESSLQQRVEESCAVIEATILRRPFGLIGSSMAGYTAIQLLEKYPISHLVLIVPAVYHVDACTPQFGQGFTEIIRQPKSWLHSDAWDRIKQFTGKLLIIYAENDDIIPAEIVHRLYESAANTEKKELYLVKNSSHRILTYLLENPNEFQKVADSIAEFLTNAYARSAL